MPDELFFRIACISIIFMRERAVRSKRKWRAELAKNETTVIEVGERSDAALKSPIVPRDERHSDDDHGIVMDDNNISIGV
jgi:hypothetical protein